MEDEESTRLTIREELANVSFEDLMKLKAEFGKQAYNEAVFGIGKRPVILKRGNKNRPRELSSKIKPKLSRRAAKKPVVYDPRFDTLCGTFDEARFEKNYSFINDLKKEEKTQLKEELKLEQNPRKKEQIKYLITRMENQEREKQRRKQLEMKKKEEHEEKIQTLKEGKKAHFQSKSEKRIVSLVEQYEQLKKSGKIHRVIQKHRKKKIKKDAQVMSTVQ